MGSLAYGRPTGGACDRTIGGWQSAVVSTDLTAERDATLADFYAPPQMNPLHPIERRKTRELLENVIVQFILCNIEHGSRIIHEASLWNVVRIELLHSLERNSSPADELALRRRDLEALNQVACLGGTIPYHHDNGAPEDVVKQAFSQASYQKKRVLQEHLAQGLVLRLEQSIGQDEAQQGARFSDRESSFYKQVGDIGLTKREAIAFVPVELPTLLKRAAPWRIDDYSVWRNLPPLTVRVQSIAHNDVHRRAKGR